MAHDLIIENDNLTLMERFYIIKVLPSSYLEIEFGQIYFNDAVHNCYMSRLVRYKMEKLGV